MCCLYITCTPVYFESFYSNSKPLPDFSSVSMAFSQMGFFIALFSLTALIFSVSIFLFSINLLRSITNAVLRLVGLRFSRSHDSFVHSEQSSSACAAFNRMMATSWRFRIIQEEDLDRDLNNQLIYTTTTRFLYIVSFFSFRD